MNCKRFTGVLLGVLIFLSCTSPAFAEDAANPHEPFTAQNEDSGVAPAAVNIYQIADATLPAGTIQDSSPVLKDVRMVEQGGQMLLIKTWDVPPGYDSDQLVEDDFESGGLRYKKAYLLVVSENSDRQTKLASETVIVSHDKKDDAITKLQPIIEYNQDGYTGQLTLSKDAIVTEAAGTNSYSYAVSDTRTYSGLLRNDPYLVPKAVEKGGITLQLVDISWTEPVDGGYTAAAQYAGTAAGTTVFGYVSTAVYMGEVSKEALDSITYAVVYEGSMIPPPPFNFSPYLIWGGSVLLVSAALFVIVLRMDNTKVYAMSGKEFQLVHKQKITALSPIIDLSPKEISGHSEEFMIVLSRFAVHRLRGQFIKIIGKDGHMLEQRIFKARRFHIGRSVGEDII